MRSGLQDIIRVGLEDVADTFGITDDLFPQVASIIVKSEPLQEIIQTRNKIDDWHDSTPLGGPGTILNGFALFALEHVRCSALKQAALRLTCYVAYCRRCKYQLGEN